MALPLQKEFDFVEAAQYLGIRPNNHFALLRQHQDGTRHQRSYEAQYVDDVLRGAVAQALKEQADLWVSQCEFFAPTRRVVHLSRIGLLFADLDTYKYPDLPTDPSELKDLLFQLCADVKLPEPSLVVYSGRGLQVKWLLRTPLPSQGLIRWNALQSQLNEYLTPLGADLQARDASRVLRAVGSINSKSGKSVALIHQNDSRYDFDCLFRQHVVDTRFDAKELAIDEYGQVRLNVVDDVSEPADNLFILRPQKGETRSPANAPDGLRRFMGSQLAWDRLADLRTLARLRGGVQDGQRDRFVFLAAVFLCQSTLDLSKLHYELLAIAREFVPHWPHSKVMACASSALARFKQHLAGQTVVYEGVEVSPRYYFRNSTLLSGDWLNVTAQEEQQLRTIVSKEEARRRAAAREQERRITAGAQTREQYLLSHEQKRATARLMKAQGNTWQRIADELGYKSAASARLACR